MKIYHHIGNFIRFIYLYFFTKKLIEVVMWKNIYQINEVIYDGNRTYKIIWKFKNKMWIQ